MTIRSRLRPVGIPALAAVAVVAVLVVSQLASGFGAAPQGPQRESALLGLTRLTQDVARTSASATDVSRGCTRAPDAPVGRTSVVSLQVGGLLRSFRLHVPSQYRAGRPTPLVVAFHGRNRSGALLEADSGLSGLPVLVAYPEGTVNEVGRLDWQIGPQAARGVDDVAMARALVTHVEARWCVDQDRVYAFGHSNGGGMAVTVACAMPRTIASVVAVSGAFYDRAAGCVGTPISLMEVHGLRDAVIPYRGARLGPEFGADVRLPRVDRWVRNQTRVNGCTGRPSLRRLGRGVFQATWSRCRTGDPVRHVRIAAGLHRVPTTATLGGTPLAVLAWRFMRATAR